MAFFEHFLAIWPGLPQFQHSICLDFALQSLIKWPVLPQPKHFAGPGALPASILPISIGSSLRLYVCPLKDILIWNPCSFLALSIASLNVLGSSRNIFLAMDPLSNPSIRKSMSYLCTNGSLVSWSLKASSASSKIRSLNIWIVSLGFCLIFLNAPSA